MVIISKTETVNTGHFYMSEKINSSNPFAILADYQDPTEKPVQREKVIRKKNKHESGAGYRSTTKREGRGKDNWGNALDDAKRGDLVEPQATEEGAEKKDEEPKPVYTAAFQYFDDSDEEEPFKITREGKAVQKIPEQYASMIAKKKKTVKYIAVEEEKDEIETGFLNSQEALKQRQQRVNNFRNNNTNARRGRPQQQRKPAAPRQAKPAAPAAAQKAEQPAEKRRPANSKPRDQRPGNVQHQRTNNAGKKPGNLNIKNFPALK